MMSYLLLPILLLKFWFFEAPIRLLKSYASFNRLFLHEVSLPLFLRTFFKPLKNEYRPGLVGFSLGMGIVIKTFLISFDLLLLAVVLLIEGVALVGFLFIPFGTLYLLTL